MSFNSFKKEIKAEMKREALMKEKEAQRIKQEKKLEDTITMYEKRIDKYMTELEKSIQRNDKSSTEMLANQIKMCGYYITQCNKMKTVINLSNDAVLMEDITKDFYKVFDKSLSDILKSKNIENIHKSSQKFDLAMQKHLKSNTIMDTFMEQVGDNYNSETSTIRDVGINEIINIAKNNINNRNLTNENAINELYDLYVPQNNNIDDNSKNNNLKEEPVINNLSDNDNKIKINNNGCLSESGTNRAILTEPIEVGNNNEYNQVSNADNDKNYYRYSGKEYIFPPIEYLKDNYSSEDVKKLNEEDLKQVVKCVENKFINLGQNIEVKNIVIGPTYSRLELDLKSNTPLRNFMAYEDDFAMVIGRRVKLLLPIPGKQLIGVEVENKKKEIIPIKKVIESDFPNKISIPIGVDMEYNSITTPIDSLPHMLIAGSAGSGKSTYLNCVITTLIYKYLPSQLRIALIDPKRVEFSKFKDIPHLLNGKIYKDSDEISQLLSELCEEMDERYKLIEKEGYRNIFEYNSFLNEKERIPVILVIIDEYADLSLSEDGKSINEYVTRLSAKARACGINIILSTQKPKANVVPQLIQSNMTTRIVFKLATNNDTALIIPGINVKDLVCRGDMFASVNNKVIHVQSPYISLEEIDNISDYMKKNTESK